MQCCTRHVISKIIRIPLVGQYNYRMNGTKAKMTTQEQQDNGLICSKWEEAIIKEQRMPDISFDSMQKNSIAHVHNKLKNKNDKKQQSNVDETMKSSN
jgi:hypothetical protein